MCIVRICTWLYLPKKVLYNLYSLTSLQLCARCAFWMLLWTIIGEGFRLLRWGVPHPTSRSFPSEESFIPAWRRTGEKTRWRPASRDSRGSRVRVKDEVCASPEPLRWGSSCSPALRIPTCWQRRREAATVSSASPGNDPFSFCSLHDLITHFISFLHLLKLIKTHATSWWWRITCGSISTNTSIRFLVLKALMILKKK